MKTKLFIGNILKSALEIGLENKIHDTQTSFHGPIFVWLRVSLTLIEEARVKQSFLFVLKS
jgi:hypothetical protein